MSLAIWPKDDESGNAYVERLYATRFTCKAYDLQQQVSAEDFHTITEAARLGASSNGLEPWHIYDLRSRELWEKLKPSVWGVPKEFLGVSRLIAVTTYRASQLRPDGDHFRHMRLDIQGWADRDFPDLAARLEKFQNSHQELSGDTALEEWAKRQAYIPMANMLTAAAILGVDSTPVEGFELTATSRVLEEAGVYDPQREQLVYFMAFGYDARKNYRPKTRRPRSEVITEIS